MGRANNSDEDDNISITSTVLSQQQEEYEVEAILAQGTFPDGIKYLVKWVGYSEDRCTWEPPDSFHDLQTLRDWRKKRSAIDRGEIAPFNVDAWEKRMQELEKARWERKRRRMAERIKLGFPDREDHDQRHNDERLQFSKRVENKTFPGDLNRGTSNSDDMTGKSPRAMGIQNTLAAPPEFPIELAGPVHEVEWDDSVDQTRLSNSRLRTGTTDGKPNNKEPKTPEIVSSTAIQELPVTPTARVSQIRLAGSGKPEIANKGRTALAKRSASNPSTQSAARNPSIPDKPVQALRRKAKKEAQSPPSPKVFRNLSTQWRFRKASHHEPAPDINQLELRRPSDWSSIPNPSMVASFAGREQRKRKLSEERPLTSPESEKLPAPRRRSDFDPHRDRDRPEVQQFSHQRKRSLDSNYDSPISPRTARSVQQHEPRVYDRYRPSPPTAESSSRGFSMGPRKGVANRIERPSSRTILIDKKRLSEMGDISCTISYGPNHTDVGEVRLCGLSPSPKKKMLEMMKYGPILLWFQYLSTLAQCDFLSRGVRILFTGHEELHKMLICHSFEVKKSATLGLGGLMVQCPQ